MTSLSASAEKSLGPLLQSFYRGPSEDRLLRGIRNTGYLYGRLEVSRLDIQTCIADERAFVALLSARLTSTLDDMISVWLAPTLPVHDEEAAAA